MHTKYKIISFDLWRTLFESNKHFKTARAKILADILVKHKILSVTEIDTMDISGILGYIKKDIDKIVEQYGVSITSFELYSAFLQTVINKTNTLDTKILSNLDFESIVKECIEKIETLLLNTHYQPFLIGENIKTLLNTLQTQGVKLVIMSNTMYMPGSTIKKILHEKLGLSIFSQFLFSDEIGFSKPSPLIYKKLITYAMGEGIKSNEILHIGDNFITDGGVKIYGMNFTHVGPESENTLEQILINITTYNASSGNDNDKVLAQSPGRVYKRLSAQLFSSKRDVNFSLKEYSRFKFGSKIIAKKFGEELVEKLISSLFFEEIIDGVKQGKQIFVVSSPYIFLPTATYAMKDYFISRLNQILVGKNITPVLEVKLNRHSSYSEEYGTMSHEQRMQIMRRDTFHIDRELIEGNIVLFLDDIRITGAHEHGVIKMLESHNLIGKITPFFLYYAMLAEASTNPTIENELNYASVENLIDLNTIIANEPFALNTRMLKYILHAPHEECKNFLIYQKDTFLHTLYSGALGNRYYNIKEYNENFRYLEQLIRFKGLIK